MRDKRALLNEARHILESYKGYDEIDAIHEDIMRVLTDIIEILADDIEIDIDLNMADMLNQIFHREAE